MSWESGEPSFSSTDYDSIATKDDDAASDDELLTRRTFCDDNDNNDTVCGRSLLSGDGDNKDDRLCSTLSPVRLTSTSDRRRHVSDIRSPSSSSSPSSLL